MAEREEILSRFFQAYQADPTLTPTRFMLQGERGPNKVKYKGVTYRTRYKNADSARRQFAKLQARETSGRVMYRRSVELYPEFEKVKPGGKAKRDEQGELIPTVAPPGGQREIGMWKATVHFRYTDEDGTEHDDGEYSFIIQATEHLSAYDAAFLQAAISDETSDRMEGWIDEYHISNVEITQIEVIKIQTYNTHGTNKGAVFVVDDAE